MFGDLNVDLLKCGKHRLASFLDINPRWHRLGATTRTSSCKNPLCGESMNGCNPKSDILERVENEISEELIAENRDYMFKVAVEKYEEQLRDKGIGGKPSLQLKLRRGKRASNTDVRKIWLIWYYTPQHRRNIPSSGDCALHDPQGPTTGDHRTVQAEESQQRQWHKDLH